METAKQQSATFLYEPTEDQVKEMGKKRSIAGFDFEAGKETQVIGEKYVAKCRCIPELTEVDNKKPEKPKKGKD